MIYALCFAGIAEFERDLIREHTRPRCFPRALAIALILGASSCFSRKKMPVSLA